MVIVLPDAVALGHTAAATGGAVGDVTLQAVSGH